MQTLRNFNSRHQGGAVLAISLVLMMVLTLLAVVTMQSTVLEQKISANTAFKSKALEGSESPRPRVGWILDAHVFERGWDGIIDPADNTFDEVEGLTMLNVVDPLDPLSDPNDLFMGDGASEDLTDPDSLITDMGYSRTFGVDVDSDAVDDFTDQKLEADIVVYQNAVHALPGHSAAMVSGYEGTGKALAGSGAAMFFDVRSIGKSASNARSATSADARIIVRN